MLPDLAESAPASRGQQRGHGRARVSANKNPGDIRSNPQPAQKLLPSRRAVVGGCLSLLSSREFAASSAAAAIDRGALLRRCSPEWSGEDARPRIALGNARLRFEVDSSGLQPLVTAADASVWTLLALSDHLRPESLDPRDAGPSVLCPFRVSVATRAAGQPVGARPAGSRRQSLVLDSGLLTTQLGSPDAAVTISTVAHPILPIVAARLTGPRGAGGTGFVVRGTGRTALRFSGSEGILTDESDGRLQAAVRVRGRALSAVTGGLVATDGGDHAEIVVQFGPVVEPMALASFDEIADSARLWWGEYWRSSGALDLGGASSASALAAERRIVFARRSSLLAPTQDAGDGPVSVRAVRPVVSGWCGAPSALLWGDAAPLERLLTRFARALPRAEERAAKLALEGARWEVGPSAASGSPDWDALQLCCQADPIWYAEHLYRLRRDRGTVSLYRDLVFSTADQMASAAVWNLAAGRFGLTGPSLAARNHPETAANPIAAIALWTWALEVAQQWRARLGMERNAEWQRVLLMLPAPARKGLLLQRSSVSVPGGGSILPPVTAALGLLPQCLPIEPAVREATLRDASSPGALARIEDYERSLLVMCWLRSGNVAAACTAMARASGQRTAAELSADSGVLLYAAAMLGGGWEGQAHHDGVPAGWLIRGEGLLQAP